MPHLEPHTVIVGAAQGIGEVVARHLSESGPVVVADISRQKVEKVAEELRTLGRDVIVQPVDITDPRSIAELVEAAPNVRRLAIVAGLFSASPSLDVEQREFQRILAVNLIGVFDTARQFSRSMISHGGGSIVAVTSIAARMPRMRQAAYSASKAGMRQALRVLGMEVRGEGVRINFVAPGPTESPMMSSLASDHAEVRLYEGDLTTFRPRIPDGRVGHPLDIAHAVEFLLSSRADHIALHDLYVDGGESLGI